MASRAKYDFPQEALAHPFVTVPLAELERALVTKKLWGRVWRDPPKRKIRPSWGSKRFGWARFPHHPTIRRAKKWSSAQILADLQAGLLVAYVPTGITGIYHRIPSRYWYEKYAGISVGRTLFDIVEGQTVSKELIGRTIYVLGDCAAPWLMQREIYQNSPTFPEGLRKNQHATTRKEHRRSSVRIWCVNKALEILKQKGGLSPDFRKSDITRVILDQKPEHWIDEEPSDSSLKRYVSEAEEQFRTLRADEKSMAHYT